MTAHRIRNFSLSFSMFFLLFIYLLRRNKLNIVSDDFNQSFFTIVGVFIRRGPYAKQRRSLDRIRGLLFFETSRLGIRGY